MGTGTIGIYAQQCYHNKMSLLNQALLDLFPVCIKEHGVRLLIDNKIAFTLDLLFFISC